MPKPIFNYMIIPFKKICSKIKFATCDNRTSVPGETEGCTEKTKQRIKAPGKQARMITSYHQFRGSHP